MSTDNTKLDELEKEAVKRYPLNHTVDDPYGETGEAETDPYGYDETARKAFIEGGKFIQSHYAKQEAEIAEHFHKHIFNHFDLLPKIQGKNGTTMGRDFNEQNYQAVACEYLNQLTSQPEKRKDK